MQNFGSEPSEDFWIGHVMKSFFQGPMNQDCQKTVLFQKESNWFGLCFYNTWNNDQYIPKGTYKIKYNFVINEIPVEILKDLL